MDNFLNVSETFYSIQGEGSSTGVPAVFLRLSGCNILCKSESWVCDSIEVWKKGVKTAFADVLAPYIDVLNKGAHLVITGGEPMLHQKKLIEYLCWFSDTYKFKPFIEVETNGTKSALKDFDLLVNKWNLSPKLSSSGEKREKRYNRNVLIWFANNHKATFKFVIANIQDWNEIVSEYTFLERNKIILMPAGETQDKLNVMRQFVVNICIQKTIRFSDRLHITIWNQKTGV